MKIKIEETVKRNNGGNDYLTEKVIKTAPNQGFVASGGRTMKLLLTETAIAAPCRLLWGLNGLGGAGVRGSG